MNTTIQSLTVAFVTTVAVSTRAEPVDSTTDQRQTLDKPTSESKAPLENTVHAHEGFYLRFGIGFGGFTDEMSAHAKDPNGAHDGGTITGMASASEVMLGGALCRNWILGGGIWTSTTFVSDYINTNNDGIPSDLRQPDNFTLVGPFVDWYFSDDLRLRSSGGFHAQAGLGFAVLNGFKPEQVRHDNRRVAVGAGLMLGFGYEWWVEEQWALGALVRLTAAGMVEEDDRDEKWTHGTGTFPAFLFTATYN